MRETKLSLKLREIFESSGRPLSVPVLLAILGRFGFRPNKTSVYRQLEKMKKSGTIEHVHFEGRAVGYELAKDHHHHLVCSKCDKVEDLSIRDEKKLLGRILGASDFKVQSHHLEIFGLCGACAR